MSSNPQASSHWMNVNNGTLGATKNVRIVWCGVQWCLKKTAQGFEVWRREYCRIMSMAYEYHENTQCSKTKKCVKWMLLFRSSTSVAIMSPWSIMYLSEDILMKWRFHFTYTLAKLTVTRRAQAKSYLADGTSMKGYPWNQPFSSSLLARLDIHTCWQSK